MGSTKRERPPKRNLVRWSGRGFGRQWRMWLTTLTDDLDKQVLLTVQYACNEAGVRIPWDDVALKMCEIVGEDKFTGGAIIQHLSKLRSKMESHALKVPPPLRRGLMVNAPSKIYAPGKKRKGGPRTAKTPKSSTARPKRSRAQNLKSDDEDDDDPEGASVIYDDDDDSDGEYENGRKKRRFSGGKGKPKKKTAVAVAEREDDNEDVKTFKVETPTIKANIVKRSNLKTEAEIQESIESPGSLPRTRGVKHDYAKMDPGSDENDEVEDGAQAEGEVEEDEYVEEERRSEGEISPLTIVETSLASTSGFVVSVLCVEFRSFANNPQDQTAESTEGYLDEGFGLDLRSSYHFGQSVGQYQPYQTQQYQMPAQIDFGFHSASSSFSTNRTGSMASLISAMALPAIGYGNPGSYDAGINNDMVISNFGDEDIMYGDQYIPPIDYTPASFHSSFNDPFLGARDNGEKVDYM